MGNDHTPDVMLNLNLEPENDGLPKHKDWKQIR